MRTLKPLVIVAFAAAALLGHAQDFTSQAAFVAALNSDYYLESFSTFAFGSPLDGTSTTYNGPGNGTFDWQAFAASGL